MAAAPGRGSTILSLAGSLLSVRNEVDGCGLWREWCAQQAVSSSPLSPGSPFIDGKLAPTHHGPLTEAAPDFFLRFRPRTKHLSREPVAVHSDALLGLAPPCPHPTALSLSITQSLAACESHRGESSNRGTRPAAKASDGRRAHCAALLVCAVPLCQGMAWEPMRTLCSGSVCVHRGDPPIAIPSGGGGNGLRMVILYMVVNI
jgi:hypothetical protein